MVRSTAEMLSSNLHPTVDSPENQRGVLRQSLVIFLRPEPQAQLRRWKGGVVDEEGIGQEGEEEGGVSRKQWLERGHLSRKIGVGCHKPGDFAKGAGTEEAEAVAFDGHKYFKGCLDGVKSLFISFRGSMIHVSAWQLVVCCPTLVSLPKYVHQLSTTHERAGHEISLRHAPHSIQASLSLRCFVPERITRRAVLIVKRVASDYFFSLSVRKRLCKLLGGKIRIFNWRKACSTLYNIG